MILYRYAENKDVFDILSLDNENFSNNFKEAFYLEYIKNQRDRTEQWSDGHDDCHGIEARNLRLPQRGADDAGRRDH